jgi:hypothetical protein
VCSLSVIVYPLYNLKKRFSVDDFAASSFAQNCSEWAVGFQLGLGLGVLCHVAVLRVSSLTESPDRKLAWRMEKVVLRLQRSVVALHLQRLRLAAGVALLVASLISAVLLGLSWDNTATGRFHDDKEDLGITVFLSITPIVVLVVALPWLVWRHQQASLGEAWPSLAAEAPPTATAARPSTNGIVNA